MEFFDVIRARYSHKAAFAPAPRPADEDLRRIVEAGMAAPSAMNRQSPEFIIITDAGLLERIGEITNNAVLKTAPAMIAVEQRWTRFTADTPRPPRTYSWRHRPGVRGGLDRQHLSQRRRRTPVSALQHPGRPAAIS